MLAGQGVREYPLCVAESDGIKSYGENAERLRGGRRQDEISTAGGWEKPSFISVLEGYRGTKIPTVETIKRHAKALGVEPWQLLEGVVTEIDQLRKPSDLLRQGGMYESPGGGDHGKTGDSTVGTEHAPSGAIQSRKAPHAEARLREEVAELRAALETVAKAVVAFGAPETPAAPSVAPRKSGRRRRTRKGA